MSVKLASASSEYLTNTTWSLLSTEPFTMAAWIYPTDSTNLQHVLLLGQVGVDQTNASIILAGHAVGDPVRLRYWDSTAYTNASTSTGYTANAWNHVLATSPATGNGTIYLNGGGSGTVEVVSISGGSRFTIGRNENDTPGNYYSGRIAHVAVWNIVLGAAEIAALAAGAIPLQVAPKNLVAYYPLAMDAGYDGIVGEKDLTESGTPDKEEGPPLVTNFSLGFPYYAPPAGGTIYEESVSNSIGLTDLSRFIDTLTLTDSLTFSQAISVIQTLTTSTAITINDAVDLEQIYGTTTELTFEQIANYLLNIGSQNDLTLQSTVIQSVIRSLQTSLSFEGVVDYVFPLPRAFANGLTITDAVNLAFEKYGAATNITFGQTLGLQLLKTIVTNVLIGTTAVRDISYSASTVLTLDSILAKTLTEDVIQAFNLQDIVDAIKQNQDNNTLAFVNSVVYQIICNRLIISNLYLTQTALYDSLTECPESIGYRKGIRLTYGDGSVDLRSPEFGNVDKTESQLIVRYTVGGELKAGKITSRPIIRRLQFSFNFLTAQQKSDLQTFLTYSYGQEIGILDHENRQWYGVIITPAVAFNEEPDNYYTAQFEFEGELE
jgi:hypothetical protein